LAPGARWLGAGAALPPTHPSAAAAHQRRHRSPAAPPLPQADAPESVPDLVLAGHKDVAQFALSTTSAAPLVASGGTDNNVGGSRPWPGLPGVVVFGGDSLACPPRCLGLIDSEGGTRVPCWAAARARGKLCPAKVGMYGLPIAQSGPRGPKLRASATGQPGCWGRWLLLLWPGQSLAAQRAARLANLARWVAKHAPGKAVDGVARADPGCCGCAQVLVWDLRDYGEYEGLLSGATKPAGGVKAAPRLQASHVLVGHSATVEDCVFRPGSESELCSVGDDFQVGGWVGRGGGGRSGGRGSLQAAFGWVVLGWVGVGSVLLG
jgi:hypothetical protein